MNARTASSRSNVVALLPGPVAKPARSPRQPRAAKAPTAFGVVAQVRASLAREHRLATFIGFLLGGFVPLATFVVAHYEVDRAAPLYGQLATALVLGGLAYSAKTVYEWGKMAFRQPAKAAGFVLLIEGVMVTSTHAVLSIAALVYLIAINGIATGCTLTQRATAEEK